MTEPILIAKNKSIECFLRPDKANRHGLITGATGTGKTITLQTMAEGFSRIGVPVFMADVKGDLTGISQKGILSEKIAKIITERALTAPESIAYPATLWDVFGQQGHPVRATVSDLGPLLLARMLNLNETQAGVLQLAFKIADDKGLLLLDMKDLRAMCQYVGDNAGDFTTEYGNVSAASVGAIQRGLLQIDEQGGGNDSPSSSESAGHSPEGTRAGLGLSGAAHTSFFGEPMLNIADFMQTDSDGKGIINILAADRLLNAPRLYATFLLWLLSELYESLPEVGDLDKPKIVFFFDEAHLLFNEAPKALLERIELIVRLVRSKGVGVYFVTQNPLDIPDSVLAQLGNRVQHALRAFTPRDQKAVKAAADTMRQNPGLDIATAITELAVGEALVSFLDEKGRPGVTERVYVLPPGSQIGPINPAQRQVLIKESIVAGVYEKTVDRASAYEKLKGRTGEKLDNAATANTQSPSTASPPADSKADNSPSMLDKAKDAGGGILGSLGSIFGGGSKSSRMTPGEQMVKSAASAIGREVGRQILRGVLGGIMGGRR